MTFIHHFDESSVVICFLEIFFWPISRRVTTNLYMIVLSVI